MYSVQCTVYITVHCPVCLKLSYLIEKTDGSSCSKDNVDPEDDEIVAEPPDPPEVTQQVEVGDAEHLLRVFQRSRRT